MLLSDLTFEMYNSLIENTALWNQKMESILHQENLPEGRLSRFTYGSNIVYSYNNELVIKLYPSFF